MKDVLLLSRAYRAFLIELGSALAELKQSKEYEGYAESFVDAVKSPEVGLSVAEANQLINIAKKFGLLEVDELPSYHIMKLMVNKQVDMDLLESAQTLSVTDFKELIKDKELGTQDRTYEYEIIKRAQESGSIKRVYGEELLEAMKSLSNKLKNQ